MRRYISYILILTLCLQWLSFFPIQAVAASSNTESIFYYFPNTDGYKSVKKNYKKIDILAPQIYTVGYDFKLGDAESKDILKLAKKKRMDVMPLVVQANFNKTLMTQILADTDIQDAIIDDLIREAKKKDFIGWQFDFENIDHLDRDRYTQFVAKAYDAMQEEDLLFSVAVIPRANQYDPNAKTQDWSSGYNIPEIAKVSDFISIMTYDDPRSEGPVASIGYVRRVLDFTLQDVPAEKVSLGVPLYCWQWQLGGTKKIASVTYDTSANTQKKYKRNGVSTHYDRNYEAEVFFFVKDDGILNYIWCDNEKSLSAKLDVVEKYGLRGISAWAIGQESKNIWKKLR